MTIYPHRIRLRGPWECEPENAEPFRIRFPRESGELSGPMIFRRRFGYPGEVDAQERIWLTFDTITGSAALSLNDRQLTAVPADVGRGTEVTHFLKPRNELTIRMAEIPESGTFGEIALEIRRTAFLRHVRAEQAHDRIQVSGQVIGEAERPLDLYLLGERNVLAQSLVTASASGTEFVLESELLAGKSVGELVRIELVDAATVWYTSEVKPETGRHDGKC